jgi:hypothetical protein
LSQEQCLALEELKKALHVELDVEPPSPLNPVHHEAHGGDANYAAYLKEYRLSVAYALYHMQKENCDFRTLIENLGHRRRHMAQQCNFKIVELYGAATDQNMITIYDPTYAYHGQKIHEKYPELPIIVKTELNGKQVFLTQINDDGWIHPDGEHRSEILDKVDCLCRKVHKDHYSQENMRALASDLSKIVWWLSHAPPFLRGTPTVISILLDAFCLYHQCAPFVKSIDLNCEALTYDNEEEFTQYMQKAAIVS